MKITEQNIYMFPIGYKLHFVNKMEDGEVVGPKEYTNAEVIGHGSHMGSSFLVVIKEDDTITHVYDFVDMGVGARMGEYIK